MTDTHRRTERSRRSVRRQRTGRHRPGYAPADSPTQFHVLSFEGPDDYAKAGGIATRVTGLTHALAGAGHETHHWYVGDPDAPGHEVTEGVHVHRWCQWLSRIRASGRGSRRGPGGSTAKTTVARCSRARELGLEVSERAQPDTDASGLLETLVDLEDVDVLSLTTPLSPSALRLLFQGSTAVLADSEHEPFRLVGLEAMAVGALTCTGGTGEDYAEPGRNALVLHSGDPREMAGLLVHLRRWPEVVTTMTARAIETATSYAWGRVIEERLLPLSRMGVPA